MAFFVLVIAAGFMKTFNLNLKTALEVFFTHTIFVVWLIAAYFTIKHTFIRWVYFLPFTISVYFACWIPAFNYWDSLTNLQELEDSAWYATTWIQFLIMFAIMVVGHFMIYYFDTDRRGR